MPGLQPPEISSRTITMVISVVTLAVVWGVVWANLPTMEELQASQVPSRVAAPVPSSPILDRAIPGVPPEKAKGEAVPLRTVVINGAEVPNGGTDLSAPSLPVDPRARQIVEMKCDAEVDQLCPQSMPGDDRQQCMERRITHFPLLCQQIFQQRLVRWKERSGHAQACVGDVKRFCRTVQSGEGRVLQCLQNHAQDVSDQCYATLPKGALSVRN